MHGTVNDLAVCGARPLFLSAGFIIEEGFATAQLEHIVDSMAAAAARACVQVVTGDTKVVPRGAADGLYITTSGVGEFMYRQPCRPWHQTRRRCYRKRPCRRSWRCDTVRPAESLDSPQRCFPIPRLGSLVQDILKASPHIHCMRDATRGGLGAVLAEIAQQSGRDISVREHDIPLRDSVRGVCEMLGLDPLYLANEGKLVVFCEAAMPRQYLTPCRPMSKAVKQPASAWFRNPAGGGSY